MLLFFICILCAVALFLMILYTIIVDNIVIISIILRPFQTYTNFFNKWEIGHYCMSYNGYCIWISNGTFAFEDYNSDKILLRGLSPYKKALMWNEYLNEVKQRSRKSIKEMTN